MSQLQRAIIYNFRNVGIRALEVGVQPCVIGGPNMSGKTNTLNAIHWAFTGKTLDGSNDDRANFPTTQKEEETPKTSVRLEFDDFTFVRECQVVDGKPTESILIDGNKMIIKKGEAYLHSKLGLSDLIINAKGKFDIVRFLLNPLYFEDVATKDLRRFFYDLANLDFDAIARQQSMAVFDLLNGMSSKDPYEVLDEVTKSKKAIKSKIDTCKAARVLFPSILKESETMEKEETKNLKKAESDEALAKKYSDAISKNVNAYFKKAMGITVCLFEEGVGDGVYKEVCYPILPKSKLPFAQGSYAERTYVSVKFIQEVCLKFNIKPLPILIDNMESLDADMRKLLDNINAPYIGAIVTQ